jgi:hypothetical protein
MLSNQELRALNRIANSSLLKGIYPMVDSMDISYTGEGKIRGTQVYKYKVAVYLNDDSITTENMYDKKFDPFFLLFHYISGEFLYYLGIPQGNNQFYIEVYSSDGSLVLSDY